jgi:hypothetical protein
MFLVIHWKESISRRHKLIRSWIVAPTNINSFIFNTQNKLNSLLFSFRVVFFHILFLLFSHLCAFSHVYYCLEDIGCRFCSVRCVFFFGEGRNIKRKTARKLVFALLFSFFSFLSFSNRLIGQQRWTAFYTLRSLTLMKLYLTTFHDCLECFFFILLFLKLLMKIKIFLTIKKKRSD